MHTARAEAFGKTATEAMACGTPVVASAVGGLPEQVLEGKTGLLVPVGDADGLAAAVGRILQDDAMHRGLAAGAAEQGARFSLSRQVDTFLAWYESVREDWARRRG